MEVNTIENEVKIKSVVVSMANNGAVKQADIELAGVIIVSGQNCTWKG